MPHNRHLQPALSDSSFTGESTSIETHCLLRDRDAVEFVSRFASIINELGLIPNITGEQLLTPAPDVPPGRTARRRPSEVPQMQTGGPALSPRVRASVTESYIDGGLRQQILGLHLDFTTDSLAAKSSNDLLYRDGVGEALWAIVTSLLSMQPDTGIVVVREGVWPAQPFGCETGSPDKSARWKFDLALLPLRVAGPPADAPPCFDVSLADDHSAFARQGVWPSVPWGT